MKWIKLQLAIIISAMTIAALAHNVFAFSQNPILSSLANNTAVNLGSFDDDPYNGSCGVAISITDTITSMNIIPIFHWYFRSQWN